MRPLKNFFAYQRAQGRGQKLKLDDDMVRLIRKRLAAGVPQRLVASEIGVAPSTISNVNKRLSWGHVDGGVG